MAEIVNLRRARKGKARAEREKSAEAGRTEYGLSKPVKKLAEARTTKETRDFAAHKLEPDTDK